MKSTGDTLGGVTLIFPTVPGEAIFKAVIVGGVTLIFIVGADTLPGVLGVQ